MSATPVQLQPASEKPLQTAARRLSEATIAAARDGVNEATFRSSFQAAISEAARDIGVACKPRDEVSLLEGRADTVYNRLVIEYKRPGFLGVSNENGNNRQAIDQAKDYITGVQRRERHEIERYAGVVSDGRFYIFLRYRDAQWHVESPVPVDVYSSERFLNYLAALQTELATSPENLLRDFGENTPLSRSCVASFYQVLTTTSNAKINVLFRQWARQFSEICGYEPDSPGLDVDSLGRIYAVRAGDRAKIQPFKLFFAIHTYYATFIKLLAVQIVNFYASSKVARIADSKAITLQQAVSLDHADLRSYMRAMEEGGIFRELGIRNFLEADFFGWYLEDYTSEVHEALRSVLTQLSQYSFVTLDTDPDGTRDLLKRLYQNLMPQSLRHALGEYYTPDWLATELLNQLHGGAPETSYRSPNERLLDPACGSGTFLVLHIRDIRLYARDTLLPQKRISRGELLKLILANVVGYDLNPLAVISARTNYLLALGDLLDEIEEEIDLPVYLADSILTPSEGDTLDKASNVFFTTSVGEFAIPRSLVKAHSVDELANMLERYVNNNASAGEFIDAACHAFSLDRRKDDRDIATVEELYTQLSDLDRQKINGVWARIIKNAFAPLFQASFDRVVGNPPWINWFHLPDQYRQRTAWAWTKYGLFEHRGLRARMGSAMDDLSVLMLYVAADRYLRKNGRLGFLITQTVFKTEGGGAGFRRLRIGDGDYLKAIQIDDFSKVQCFDGATNRTAAVILEKGAETQFPIPYRFFRKTGNASIPTDASHSEAMARLKVLPWVARPVDSRKKNSPWISGREAALESIEKIFGRSIYKGRKGSCTYLNGVYWVEVLSKRKDELVVSNLYDTGKIRVKSVTTRVEPALVFPQLRGRDVGRWRAAPTCWAIIPQNPADPAKGFPEDRMRAKLPKTYAYFKQFEVMLRRRSGFRKYFDTKTAPFYSIFNVGPYTYSEHKVVWREQASLMTAAVPPSRLNGKTVVPDHKLILCACETDDEAHYVCALLNSIPSQFLLKGYGLETSISTNVFYYLSILKYDRRNQTHLALAANSKALHASTAVSNMEAIITLENENLNLAAEYWKLKKSAVSDIKVSLEEQL